MFHKTKVEGYQITIDITVSETKQTFHYKHTILSGNAYLEDLENKNTTLRDIDSRDEDESMILHTSEAASYLKQAAEFIDFDDKKSRIAELTINMHFDKDNNRSIKEINISNEKSKEIFESAVAKILSEINPSNQNQMQKN